ncbi:hypothetical protein [Serratia marcescens]|uniref:Uncharacterized protein n=1 Tax=Serratia marcescens TaxID=615 RepID=A0ABD5BC37_SERMA|nr:hypothetical protein [Serratia marcescens]MDQ9401631.1 hypothetical protein [Serratia marcescens]MDQ9529248.1 hypothetical protein [Serratia marcescens]MDQ9535721.1 hypothetical protein [Serratia marcescens]MDQ9542113.1 hypothetical protein [Serratia marcescens]MDQ9553945.1 hypothetical protein [Serratia marcescens]
MSKAGVEELNFIQSMLEKCGYKLSPHGAAVSLMLMDSDYNKEETLSYVGLIALAQNMRTAGDGMVNIMQATGRGAKLAAIIKNLHDYGYIRTELFNNDISAISRLTNLDADHKAMIGVVLGSDPHADADDVAINS